MTPCAKASLSFILCLFAIAPARAAREHAADLANKQIALRCDQQVGVCTLKWRDGTELGPFAAAVDLEGGKHWTTTDFPKHQIERGKTSSDLTIRHSGIADAPILVQHIALPANQPYLLMDLEVIGKQTMSTRHIAPLVLANGGSARLTAGEKPSVVFVPWDNDMWVHYNEPANLGFDPAKDPDSYEVTAIYDNASRNGLVLGSITHDLWRTGILARQLSNKRVDELEVYGGATGHWSHDVEPHGLVSGTSVKSPQIMVGYFSDWRDGMEAYGRENARIKPPLPWKDGVPFGWNSWAAYLQKVDLNKYEGVADFIHTELEPKGYENNHTTYVNWDAGWSELKHEDILAAAQHAHAQGQKAGIYFTPFSYWSDDFSKVVEGTDGKYKYSDLLLRDSHGQPLPKIDGAHPLDPTHPGTLARIDWQLAQFVAWGYDSVKLDFLNCGSLEGVHHDPHITTGVAAYNLGMKRIEDDLAPKKIGRPFFISLSIAPLFPAYGHARRISCDAFGRIEDSDYLLNAATFGWWSNGTLYQFNDPDHTVLSKDKDPYHDQSLKDSVQTLEEARSRMNATVISGTLLLDSDDLTGQIDPRAPQRAKELLTNKAVLDVARAGRSFRPVEGDSGIHAAPIFMRTEKDGSVYVAVFNYSEDKPTTLHVDLSRLGLNATQTYRMTDLWTDEIQEAVKDLKLSLTPAQSRLLHFTPE
jgi:alpha-galactosidase